MVIMGQLPGIHLQSGSLWELGPEPDILRASMKWEERNRDVLQESRAYVCEREVIFDFPCCI